MPQLTVNERGNITHVFKFDYLDLQAIGTGNSKTIFTLPVGAAVEFVGILKTVQVAGTSSLVIDVGYSGTAGAFISAWDADAATTNLPVYNTGSDFVQVAGNTTIKGGSLPIKAVSASTPVLLKVTDAALASATAGTFVVAISVIDLGRFA